MIDSLSGWFLGPLQNLISGYSAEEEGDFQYQVKLGNEYPGETTWYVQGRMSTNLNANPSSEGSAVCIRLRKKKESEKSDPGFVARGKIWLADSFRGVQQMLMLASDYSRSFYESIQAQHPAMKYTAGYAMLATAWGFSTLAKPVGWLEIMARPRGTAYQAEETKKYLLTCQHVIRRSATNGVLGKPLRNFHAWRANARYDDKPVPLAISDLCDVPQEAIKDVAENDWVLLEFVNAEDEEVAREVKDWDCKKRNGLKIFGFPGGRVEGLSGAAEDQVLVDYAKDFDIRRRTAGTLTLRSTDQTRGGMSGGGVFDVFGNLAGIHRSFRSINLQYTSVNTEAIRRTLSEQGYALVPRDVEYGPPQIPWLMMLIALVSSFALTMFATLYIPESEEIILQRVREQGFDNQGDWPEILSKRKVIYYPSERETFSFDKFEELTRDMGTLSRRGYRFDFHLQMQSGSIVPQKFFDKFVEDNVNICGLNLKGIAITQTDCEVINKLAPELTRLNLSDCGLGVEEMRSLVGETDFPKLSYLNLENNRELTKPSVLRDCKLERLLESVKRNTMLDLESQGLQDDLDDFDFEMELQAHFVLPQFELDPLEHDASGFDIDSVVRWLSREKSPGPESPEFANRLFEIREIQIRLVGSGETDLVSQFKENLKFAESLKILGRLPNQEDGEQSERDSRGNVFFVPNGAMAIPTDSQREFARMLRLVPLLGNLKRLDLEIANLGDELLEPETWLIQRHDKIQLDELRLTKTKLTGPGSIAKLLKKGASLRIESSARFSSDLAGLSGLSKVDLKFGTSKTRTLPRPIGLEQFLNKNPNLERLFLEGVYLGESDLSNLLRLKPSVDLVFGDAVDFEERDGKLIEIAKKWQPNFTMPKGVISPAQYRQHFKIDDLDLLLRNVANVKQEASPMRESDEMPVEELVRVDHVPWSTESLKVLIGMRLSRLEFVRPNRLIPLVSEVNSRYLTRRNPPSTISDELLRSAEWRNLKELAVNNASLNTTHLKSLQYSDSLISLDLQDMPELSLDLFDVIRGWELKQKTLKLHLGGIYGLPRGVREENRSPTHIIFTQLKELRLGFQVRGNEQQELATVVLESEWKAFRKEFERNVFSVGSSDLAAEFLDGVELAKKILILPDNAAGFERRLSLIEFISIHKAAAACLKACYDQFELDEQSRWDDGTPLKLFSYEKWNDQKFGNWKQRAEKLVEYLPKSSVASEVFGEQATAINLWLPAFLETQTRIAFRSNSHQDIDEESLKEIAKEAVAGIDKAIKLLNENQSNFPDNRIVLDNYDRWHKQWELKRSILKKMFDE